MSACKLSANCPKYWGCDEAGFGGLGGFARSQAEQVIALVHLITWSLVMPFKQNSLIISLGGKCPMFLCILATDALMVRSMPGVFGKKISSWKISLVGFWRCSACCGFGHVRLLPLLECQDAHQTSWDSRRRRLPVPLELQIYPLGNGCRLGPPP